MQQWVSVKDVPLSMFRSKSLWIFQTVCFHLDGYDVVTWNHGQTQNSGLSLGECVCNHRTTKQLFFLIYHLILSSHSIINVQNDYCEYYSSIYTKVPFIRFNFIYRAPHTIKLSLGALLRRSFIFHKSKKKKISYPTCRFEELLSWSKDDITVSVCAEEQSHQGSTICHANPHVFVQESF